MAGKQQTLANMRADEASAARDQKFLELIRWISPKAGQIVKNVNENEGPCGPELRDWTARPS
jgi:hypothetical protein